MIARATHDNLTALQQGIDLLAHLDAASYSRPVPAVFGSSAGGHLRHIVEHYQSLFAGLDTGAVDYEARPRDGRIETDLTHALAVMRGIVTRLQALSVENENRALRVRAESGGHGDAATWGGSSLLRELEFLLSHTIHHYALIAVVCGLQGHVVPEDFGVAPSTLRHRQTQAVACAR